jgi:hypothetical protein
MVPAERTDGDAPVSAVDSILIAPDVGEVDTRPVDGAGVPSRQSDGPDGPHEMPAELRSLSADEDELAARSTPTPSATVPSTTAAI